MTSRDKKVARAKATLLWGLIIDTPQTGALAEPLQKGIRFNDLEPEHKITVLGLVREFEEGCREIERKAPPDAAPAVIDSQAQQGAEVVTGEIVERRDPTDATPVAALGDEETDPPPPDPAPAPATEAA
jgi:hypothetical protein